MKLRIIIISIIFSTLLYSQNFELTKIDSSRLVQKYNLLLNNKLETSLPLSSLGNIIDPYEILFDTNLINEADGNLSHLNLMAMSKIKTNINQSFSVIRKGQNKYNLGVVGDVLTYVNAAAVAGLAGYHLYKYRKRYGLK